MSRVAIYARYSTDQQRAQSIDDQLRLCRDYAQGNGWEVVAEYADHALSGATLNRPQLQALLEDARRGRFDLVLVESIDRLSRAQSGMARVFEHLNFAETALWSVTEGEINNLHIGLRGTVNALQIKDAANKTRRTLEGNILDGRSAGGLAYGYDIVFHEGRRTGKRSINAVQAAIVRRIFSEFVAGRSPRQIAFDLNAEGIPAPRSDKAWSPSTIYGNWRRGTGILNNSLYVGLMVWNRQRYLKDPETGKRQARLNTPDRLRQFEHPSLRIVPDELWQAAKQLQERHRKERPEKARRPVHLLSGLLACGRCGGGFSKVSAHHYGCSRTRNTGTCSNRLVIRQDKLEAMVLDGLRNELMQPDAVTLFIEEFERVVTEQTRGFESRQDQLRGELAKIERQQANLIQALKEGTPARLITAELNSLEDRAIEIQKSLAHSPPAPPRLPPNIGEIYQKRVGALEEALADPTMTTKAALALRDLISSVRLTPENGELVIDLIANRNALFSVAPNTTVPSKSSVAGEPVPGLDRARLLSWREKRLPARDLIPSPHIESDGDEVTRGWS